MRDLNTRNAEAAQTLEALATSQKLSLRVLEMDVCDAASIQRAVNIILQEQGRIDVAVNNAGFMSIGLAEGFTEEQAVAMMRVLSDVIEERFVRHGGELGSC